LRRNCLLKHDTEGKIEDKEEDVRSLRATLKKREDTGS
jgi:hypothetical protein